MKPFFFDLIVVLFLTMPFLPAAWAQEEDSKPAQRKIHTIMAADMRETARLIQDGFLMGDLDSVRRASRQLRPLAKEARAAVPLYPGAQEEVAHITAEIGRAAQDIEERANAGDWAAAYEDYTRVIKQCIACHRLARDWGRFPDKTVPPTSEDKPKRIGEK